MVLVYGGVLMVGSDFNEVFRVVRRLLLRDSVYRKMVRLDDTLPHIVKILEDFEARTFV